MGRNNTVDLLSLLSLLYELCLPFVEDSLDLRDPFGCADEVVIYGAVGEGDEVLFIVVGGDGDVLKRC